MNPEIRAKYRQALARQLEDWKNGIYKHTDAYDLPEGIEAECCPDFACCNPKLAWSAELRQRFIVASEAERNSMLYMALSAFVIEETRSGEVYMAGQENSRLTH